MEAHNASLLDLLSTNNRREIPVFQRVYSWGVEECERLWNDVVRAGSTANLRSHFTGSIVYVASGQGTATARKPHLVIDGQQRLTTVMLLLAALAEHIESLPETEQEPVEGFAPRMIRDDYLRNANQEGDKAYKLLLSKSDRDALNAIVDGRAQIAADYSRVTANFQWFKSKLSERSSDLVDICLGLMKLVIVDVELTRGEDDPQLVFETMNSTGKALSQADLIRNFVLMDLPTEDQNRLYDHYWLPMEQRFMGDYEPRFDVFVRHYLTLKTASIPRESAIYEAFRTYAREQEERGKSRSELVKDLSEHSLWYSSVALNGESNQQLAARFLDVERLQATVVYPFLLRVYGDYARQRVSEREFLEILETLTSYLLRRAACEILPNTHRTTFASLANAIDPNNYVESIKARLLSLPWRARFPSDFEFTEKLQTINFYSFRRRSYFFRKLENFRRKEEVVTGGYTVEHIMPQNENLSDEWQKELGSDWRRVHEQYLHVLGNLTLTGYNSEYSDLPFSRKQNMENGFRYSPLRLNEGLGELKTWNEHEIVSRGRRLAKQAVDIWPYPHIDPNEAEKYADRYRDTGSFNWKLTHRILEEIPPGVWTTYGDLAEAVGTRAQPLAAHVSKCRNCVNAYRVLTSEGRLAEGFRWSDPLDERDPRLVLEAEGVRFIGDVADSEQRLNDEDLVTLVSD